MIALPIWAIIIIGLAGLFFLGIFDACIDLLLHHIYVRHQRIRRHQRPSRIFLVRHGESQANIDTSNCF